MEDINDINDLQNEIQRVKDSLHDSPLTARYLSFLKYEMNLRRMALEDPNIAIEARRHLRHLTRDPEDIADDRGDLAQSMIWRRREVEENGIKTVFLHAKRGSVRVRAWVCIPKSKTTASSVLRIDVAGIGEIAEVLSNNPSIKQALSELIDDATSIADKKLADLSCDPSLNPHVQATPWITNEEVERLSDLGALLTTWDSSLGTLLVRWDHLRMYLKQKAEFGQASKAFNDGSHSRIQYISGISRKDIDRLGGV